MQISTVELIKTALRCDETVAQDERARLVRLLTAPGAGNQAQPAAPARVVRFKEVAARLGCRPRTARYYVSQGLLDPVRLRARAVGVTEESINRLLAGRGGAVSAAG